ncbi:MAG: PHP domain-containing protein [Methanomassiliicoccaceae archaeon]|jgi:predicted metal-dependent phosphoesterase TrpH|nr:PHP domain-containing protein [Methanomassiliicoccaceae archaeon]
MRLRADLHVHTIYSGVGRLGQLRFPESIDRPEAMVDIARTKKLDVLCITDHNSINGALIAKEYAKQFDDIEVVVGEEVSTKDGEIIGLWLTELIPPKLSAEETVRRIREQGGIVIAPHPFSFHVPALNEKIFDLDIDGIEVLNGGHIDKYSNRMASEVSKKYPGKWAEISSSDAHSASTFGYAWTEFEGNDANDLRKAILAQTTMPCGTPVPIDRAVVWSMKVVYKGFKMMLKAMFGRLRPDPDDPLVTSILRVPGHKRVAGILGAMIFLFPPIPFLASAASNTWLNRRATVLLDHISETLEKIGPTEFH